MTRKEKKLINKYREKIEKAILQNGKFSHNIIGLCLLSVYKEMGCYESNKLIDEYNITELYGISKVYPTEIHKKVEYLEKEWKK